MRRKKQELNLPDTLEILETASSGVLALAANAEYPYAVPLNYVYEDGSFFFHGAAAGHKMDLIQQNSKASFCVIGQDLIVPEEYTSYFKSAIAFGNIEIIENQEEKKQVLTKLLERFSPDEDHQKILENEALLKRTGIFVMRVEHLTGKVHSRLVGQE